MPRRLSIPARKKVRSLLRARDGKLCAYCGDRMTFDIARRNDPLYATIEHITPLSEGGDHALSNLVLVHRKCNK